MIKLVITSTLLTVAVNAALPTSPFGAFKKPLPAPVYKPLPVAPVYKPLPVAPVPFLPKPQTYSQYPIIPILRSESDISPDGSHYQYAYETGNGISANERGDLIGSGPDAGIAAQGAYQYTSPEGVPVSIQYLADQNGFQPSGNVLPTPPPIPEAILRSLQYNEAHPETPQRQYY